MKKLLKHYGSIFSVYGPLTPVVVIALTFVILVAMDRNDTFSALIKSNLGGFIAFGVIGVLAIAAFAFLVIFKIKSNEVNALDLALLILTVLSLLLLVLFCFTGSTLSFISIAKWACVAVAFVGSLILTFARSRFTK